MWHASSIGEDSNSYNVMVTESEENRERGRPRCRCEDNIKNILKYNGRVWNGFIWHTIGSSGWLLCICKEHTFSLQQNSWSVELAVSGESLTSMQLVRCMS